MPWITLHISKHIMPCSVNATNTLWSTVGGVLALEHDIFFNKAYSSSTLLVFVFSALQFLTICCISNQKSSFNHSAHNMEVW